MTTVGLEPTIFGSEDRRLIHWATRPIVNCPMTLAVRRQQKNAAALDRTPLFAAEFVRSVVGLVVRISAFHADGPGSIPGRRILCEGAVSLVFPSN